MTWGTIPPTAPTRDRASAGVYPHMSMTQSGRQRSISSRSAGNLVTLACHPLHARGELGHRHPPVVQLDLVATLNQLSHNGLADQPRTSQYEDLHTGPLISGPPRRSPTTPR